MKKIIFTLVIVCITALYSQAQFKPEGGSFTTEMQFAPFSSSPLSEVGLRGRYFFSDNIALRLNFDFGLESAKVVSGTGTSQVTSKQSETMFGLAPGIEYHLGNLERVSPYVGAEIGFVTYGTKEKIEGNNYSSEIINGGNNREGYNAIGLNIVLGTDVYVVKGLYLGAEMGLGFGITSIKKGESSTTIGGNTTSNKYEDKMNAKSLSFNCTPQIRLGWRF